MALFGNKGAGQAYRTLCQNAACRATLGTMHIPCTGGRVVFVCWVCGTISAFTNDPYEIKAAAVDKVPPEEMKKMQRLLLRGASALGTAVAPTTSR